MYFAKKYKTIIFAIIIVFLTSCTPQKRLTRLLHRHSYLTYNDTVFHEKKIITSGIWLDTTFIINSFKIPEYPDLLFVQDTFIIRDERIKGSLILDANRLKLSLKQEPDTIRVPVPEYRTRYVTNQNEKKQPNTLLVALIVAGIYSVLLSLIAIKRR
ncbi:MAG: hypothetical protein PHP31_07550 [Lentimicrobiaceae bacterium]|nr:hypothetical protein [Lentimicrobiaceae bacterium]